MKSLKNILNQDFELLDIDNLLIGTDIDSIRIELSKEFLKLKFYTNLDEWNKLVSVCELLAHIGWESKNQYEASKSKFFNGNPYTSLRSQFGEPAFLTALWSKRKDGYAIETDRVTYWLDPETMKVKELEKFLPEVKNGEFKSQRNWVQKSPIKIGYFMSNSTVKLNYIKEKIKEINNSLSRNLSNKPYGFKLQFIYIKCSFESKWSSINKTGFEIKRFRKKTGILDVHLFFADSFGDQTKEVQKTNLMKMVIDILMDSKMKLAKQLKKYNWIELEKDLRQVAEKVKTDL